MDSAPLIKDNVANVRQRIDAALNRSGRGGDRVAIVGITKTMGHEQVEELITAGISDIGENRVQELLEKISLVKLPCRWHFVGTLQRNKAAKVIGKCCLLHSLDSVKLARTLSRLGEDQGVVTRALLEINTSGEDTKHGFLPEQALDRAGEILEMPFLKIEGLMTIGPLTSDTGRIREAFKSLYGLRDEIKQTLLVKLPELSMGMSDDFEIAVEDGATLVRLGRVLLGERT